LRLYLSANGCWGLIEYFYIIILFILFTITIFLALWASLRKREHKNNEAEPITLTIIILTFLILIGGRIFEDKIKGDVWIKAEDKNSSYYISGQTLTLRNNGTFRIDLNGADVSCYYSGKYQKHSDTIILDKEVIDKTYSTLSNKYYLQDSLFIPLDDTSVQSTRFDTLHIMEIN